MDLRTSRRGVLAGAAAIAAAGLVKPVLAQEVKLTDEDLLVFAETIELAAVGFYGALRPKLSRPAAVSAATQFAKHHEDHAGAFGAAAGGKRIGKPNPILLGTLDDQLGQARDENGAIKVAYDLESSLASTYLFIIDSATSAATLQLAASVMPVDGQHAVVLGTLIGQTVKNLTAPDKDQLGYESEDKHLDPAAYPPVVTTTTAAPENK